MINRGWKLGILVCFLSIVLFCGPALAAEKPAKPIKLGVLFIMSGPMGGYGKHGSAESDQSHRKRTSGLGNARGLENHA